MTRQTNPMGWGRMLPSTNCFQKPVTFEQLLCEQLTERFVHQTLLVKDVSLKEDPETGQQVVQFWVDAENPLRRQFPKTGSQEIPIQICFTE